MSEIDRLEQMLSTGKIPRDYSIPGSQNQVEDAVMEDTTETATEDTVIPSVEAEETTTTDTTMTD